MRATRNFMVHRRNPPETRRFVRGEWIPEEWRALINVQSLVDAPLPHLEPTVPDPYPELGGLTTIDQVVGWVHSAGGKEDRVARALYALEVEEGPDGKGRKTLVRALTAVVEAS